MAISLPSREVYAVDVPSVRSFEAKFQYNFFTPDESVNESGGIPSSILKHPSDNVDAGFIQFASSRAPRMVIFNWSIPKIASVGDAVSDRDIRNNSFKTTNAQNNSLIADNINNVVTEDHFSSNNFVATSFHDSQIDDKVFEMVSGSFVSQKLGKPSDPNIGHEKAAVTLSGMTPEQVSPQFLSKALVNPARTAGVKFVSKPGQIAIPVSDRYFDALKNVIIHSQINSKFFLDITDRAIEDPNSQYAGDLQGSHQFAKKVKTATQQQVSSAVSESDYKTFVPYIDLTVRKTMSHADGIGAQIVGYIIDKVEMMSDGTTKAHAPVIVDSAHVGTTADFNVKYNSSYTYAIRTVALFNLPAVDDDTGDVAMIKVLVSSRPSNRVMVATTEMLAPPSPADFNMFWNFETDKLFLTWAFPPNSQRDIKKFQVFKRANVNVPFELQKQYDFDDSVQPFPDAEDPDPRLIEVIKEPVSFWTDDEFDRTLINNEEAAPIYALACIDAHGLTSPLSAQFKVWFDPFMNKLQKKLISHLGAPKPYPNLYLEAETFVNTIKVSGANSKRMKLYFNPEYYHLYDDQGRFIKVLSTKQDGGNYIINFMNLDNGLSQQLTVTIDDQVKVATGELNDPQVTFGQKKKSSAGPSTIK